MPKHSMRAKWNTANAKLANEPFANLFDDPSRVCVRCGREYTLANKKYSRLYGVMCVCGSQEWKAVEHVNAPDKSFALPCKVCGKPIGLDGHVVVADVDGKEIVTAAYCAEHWQKLGE